jgi:thiamine pyrophosphokinase
VLALNGASVSELRRAWAEAGRLAADRMLVAVDGGLDTCRRAGRRPDLLVGDGDSLRSPARGIESVRFPAAKDFSDLGGALTQLARRRVPVVCVAGLLGGRLDHEWANLSELGLFAPRFTGIVAPASRATVVITAHGCDVETSAGRTFSMLALEDDTRVTLRGARWSLRRRLLRRGSHGLSNVVEGPLRLEVHSGAVALIL